VSDVDLDTPDAEVIETARREMQQSIDEMLERLARGERPNLADTGHAVESVAVKRSELRLVDSFDLALPPLMRAHARHWVYRNIETGQPFVLSAEKKAELERLGYVAIVAFIVDAKRRN